MLQRSSAALLALVSSALSPCPALAAAAAAQPNILMLFPDQMRWDWAGSLEGMSSLRMPTLEALAASGTRFRQAFVASPLCAPSRACLASGREYDQAGVPDNFHNDYPINQTTFYSLLKGAGYHTMTTGKDDLTKSSGCGLNGTYHAEALGFVDFLRVKGKDDVKSKAGPSDPYGAALAQQNTTVNGKSVSLWDVYMDVDNDCCASVPGGGSGYFCETATVMPEPYYEDNFVAADALALLDRKPAGVPWFLQVSFPGPHPPFIVTQTMLNSTTSEQFPVAVDNSVLTRANNEAIRELYAAELQNLDALFAQVLAKVDALGERDNTLVVIASDHGEMLGDHSDWGKTMPWQGSASVPLIVSGPKLGVVTSVISGVPVATMDLAGTVLELAGAAPAAGMTTRSFANVLRGAPPAAYARPFVSSGLGGWRMVVKADDSGHVWKLVCCHGVCPGAPSNSTGAGEAARGFVGEEWRGAAPGHGVAGEAEAEAEAESAYGGGAGPMRLLYDVLADAYDQHNVFAANPTVAAELQALLPEGFCV